MFGFISKAVKSVSSAVKSVANNPIVKVAGSVGLMVPGVAQVAAGVQIADTVVKAANGVASAVHKPGAPPPTPTVIQQRKAKAIRIIQTTKLLAVKGKTPAIRRGAANGLTLMKKRHAALKFVKQNYTVNARGVVVKLPRRKAA